MWLEREQKGEDNRSVLLSWERSVRAILPEMVSGLSYCIASVQVSFLDVYLGEEWSVIKQRNRT